MFILRTGHPSPSKSYSEANLLHAEMYGDRAETENLDQFRQMPAARRNDLKYRSKWDDIS